MKNIEVPDDVYAALTRIAKANHLKPSEVLSAFLAPTAATTAAGDSIANFFLTSEFQELATPEDKYLAVLAWIAAHHASEFAEFVERDPSASTYLRFSRDQILRACRGHVTRQIDGTRYWAIMNITSVQKRRFMAKLLEFVGYDAPVAEIVCQATGIGSPHRRGMLLVA